MQERLSFSNLLINWQRCFGRNNLPWQVSDPYQIWISEIMLQQTQVKTVLDFFPKFIQAFPTIKHLANAKEEDVLNYWAGLGYYARARNLHRSAQIIYQQYGQDFPKTRNGWEQLKGIGRSTAAAIVAFAFHEQEAILDGNVKRILARLFALDFNIAEQTNISKLWKIAETLLPPNQVDMPIYTQGLMDLGAMICTKNKPKCEQCPVAVMCQSKQQNKVHLLPISKKKLTVKRLDFYWPILIVESDLVLLLERKSGIWAKLLSPPTFESRQEMLEWFNLQAFKGKIGKELSIIKHRLTHRELNIHVFEIKLSEKNQAYQECYFNIQKVFNERIPKPFKMLIRQRYLTS